MAGRQPGGQVSWSDSAGAAAHMDWITDTYAGNRLARKTKTKNFSTPICLYRHPNGGLPLIAISYCTLWWHLMRLYTADLFCYLAAIVAHCFAQNDSSRMTDKFKPTNVRMHAPVEFLVLFGHFSSLLLLTLGERKVLCQVTVVTRKGNEPGGMYVSVSVCWVRMNWVYLWPH